MKVEYRIKQIEILAAEGIVIDGTRTPVFETVRKMDELGTLLPFVLRSEWLNHKKGQRGYSPPMMNLDLDIKDWKKRRSADSVTFWNLIDWEYFPSTEEIEIRILEGDNFGHRLDGPPRCKFTLSGVSPRLLITRFPGMDEYIDILFQNLVQVKWQKRKEERENAVKELQMEMIAAEMIAQTVTSS